MSAKIFSLEEFLDNMDFFLEETKKNKVFIYPTDTVYGIGMIYSYINMGKINLIKKRDENKLCSMIIPNYIWLENNYKKDFLGNFFSSQDIDKYISDYKYITIIFDYNYPGIRIIKHPFQGFVEKLGEPFISTSVNITGLANITSISEIDVEILQYVDYIIDGGILDGSPSTLINLVSGEIIKR